MKHPIFINQKKDTPIQKALKDLIKYAAMLENLQPPKK